ncbi:hypothetical protein CHUAL_001684, partial [Chamberlinius hualienensis]
NGYARQLAPSITQPTTNETVSVIMIQMLKGCEKKKLPSITVPVADDGYGNGGYLVFRTRTTGFS